jgi:dTDP-glucose pyrophosphorylase
LNYTYQEGEGGIAAALSLAEHFADRTRSWLFSATTSSRKISERL